MNFLFKVAVTTAVWLLTFHASIAQKVRVSEEEFDFLFDLGQGGFRFNSDALLSTWDKQFWINRNLTNFVEKKESTIGYGHQVPMMLGQVTLGSQMYGIFIVPESKKTAELYIGILSSSNINEVKEMTKLDEPEGYFVKILTSENKKQNAIVQMTETELVVMWMSENLKNRKIQSYKIQATNYITSSILLDDGTLCLSVSDDDYMIGRYGIFCAHPDNSTGQMQSLLGVNEMPEISALTLSKGLDENTISAFGFYDSLQTPHFKRKTSGDGSDAHGFMFLSYDYKNNKLIRKSKVKFGPEMHSMQIPFSTYDENRKALRNLTVSNTYRLSDGYVVLAEHITRNKSSVGNSSRSIYVIRYDAKGEIRFIRQFPNYTSKATYDRDLNPPSVACLAQITDQHLLLTYSGDLKNADPATMGYTIGISFGGERVILRRKISLDDGSFTTEVIPNPVSKKFNIYPALSIEFDDCWIVPGTDHAEKSKKWRFVRVEKEK